MAIIQSGDQNLPRSQRSLAIRQRSLVSQSRKWLTERLGYLPQVRRFFGEELPQLSKANLNFEDS
jgi:hypothetical protein